MPAALSTDQSLDPGPPPRKQTRPRAAFWPLLAAVPVLVQLGLSLQHLKASWDDAAITAAFARTWAETGRIALTPTSPVVEGYSSLSWFLLLGAPFKLAHNPQVTPDAVLVAMKVFSAIAALLSLWLVYRIALGQLGSRRAAGVSVVLTACCYTTLQDIRAGMEMNLATLLLLLLVHTLTRDAQRGRWIFAWLVGSLLLMTRFEMPYMVFFLVCGLVVASLRSRPDALSLARIGLLCLALAVSFAAVEAWRHHAFGLWMPNTIYAKRFVPYRNWSSRRSFLLTRWLATVELFSILGVPIVVAAAVVLRARLRGGLEMPLLKTVHPAVWSLALGSVVFGVAFGQNWGYDGRMVSSMVPFLILALVALSMAAVRDPAARRAVFGLMVVLQLAFWLYFTARPPDITPVRVIENLGRGAEVVRVALGRDHLTILMPDVGGSALCCERLAVIDAGLLTDPTLARTGWPGFLPYFHRVDPDLVETHSIWAQQSGLYSDGALDGYSIVAANGVRYFLRNDLYRQLLARHSGAEQPIRSAPGCLPPGAGDREFSLRRGSCIVLNEPGVSRNSL